MEIGLNGNKGLVYLTGLQTILSERKFYNTAKDLGIGMKMTAQKMNGFRRTYGKIADASYTVDLTKSDLQHIVSGLQNLDYLYSFADDSCELMLGGDKEQIDLYLDEARHAVKGKRALREFYTYASDPQML